MHFSVPRSWHEINSSPITDQLIKKIQRSNKKYLENVPAEPAEIITVWPVKRKQASYIYLVVRPYYYAGITTIWSIGHTAGSSKKSGLQKSPYPCYQDW